MKITALDNTRYGRYVKVEFPEQIPFTLYRGPRGDDIMVAILTEDEADKLIDQLVSFRQDTQSLRDDPSNVDTDPPDEYNVFEDEDGHACNTTVDGG